MIVGDTKRTEARQVDTKERILDAAESLFAESGFHRTTMRVITTRAGVNLASINYHFGTKESLLDAVFERRIAPLNAARLDMLERVRMSARSSGARPRTADIMRAFIEPPFRFRASEDGFAGFVRVLGHTFTEPDDTLRKKLLGHMGPVVELFLESMKEALPGLPEEVISMRFHFAIGSLVLTMFGCGDEVLPDGYAGKCSGDPCGMLVDFVAAGMEALYEK
jgi:AcrR family transcriptional regulator